MLTFIPDIAEEHFDELQFLWTQRRRALRSAAHTMREMGMLEERIEAHVQGLLVLGDHLPEFVDAGLRGDDEMPAFAAAYALLRLGTADAQHRVREAFVASEGKRLEGLREAISHGPAQYLIPLLQSLFTSAPPPLAVAAGEALAFHKSLQLSPEQIVPLLRDEAPAVRRSAWRIVSYCALSKRWLNTLPADLREMVITESRAVYPWGVKISDELIASLTKKWEDRGGKINRLSDAEMKVIRDKFATVGTTITEGKPELRAFYNELKAVSERTP